MKEVFKSKNHALLSLVSGSILVIVYKLWKLYLRTGLELHPSSDYYIYELYSTGFRYFGAIVSIGFCIFAYKDQSYIWKNYSRKCLGIILGFLVVYFSIRFIFLSGYIFVLKTFLFELMVNVSVGFWEEFAFRGLIFAALCRYINLNTAMFISSVAFSLWHFDVHQDLSTFLLLFLSGGILAYLFYLKNSLLVVSIFHFLWDQIYFGFHWKGAKGSEYQIAIFVLEIFVFILLAFLANQKNQNRSTASQVG